MAEIHADHHHNPALGHHFESMEQQHESNILGMWLFLSTEIMLFGALFAAYILFRVVYPDIFTRSSHHQDAILGAINTGVLIGSSLTMALAVRSAQVASKRSLQIFLLLTALLGTVFLGIKAVEYYDHWEHGLVPGFNFITNEETHIEDQLFFFLYFVMTGIHAVHLIIGIGIVLFLFVRARAGRYLGEAFLPVELMGLYWHFIDVVWVFLFPLLYLIGRH